MKKETKDLTIRVPLPMWESTRKILFYRKQTFQDFLIKKLEELSRIEVKS